MSDYKDPQYPEEWDTWMPDQTQNRDQHSSWLTVYRDSEHTNSRDPGVATMNNSWPTNQEHIINKLKQFWLTSAI